MLLSTVIPVYNSEPYLRQAVDSIIGQALPAGEHEILLIDDGSTDGSPAICDDYAAARPALVRVVHTTNAGVSAARNTGLAAARGTYVHFMDSDDRLIPGSYAHIIAHYLDSRFDYIGFWSVTLDRIMRERWVETGDTSGRVVYEGSGRDYYCDGHSLPFSWMGLYRTAFLRDHGITFDRTSVIAEDVRFNLRFAMADPQMRLTSSTLYRYEVRDNSALAQRAPAKMRRMVESYLALFEAIDAYRRSCPAFSAAGKRMLDAQMVPLTSRVLSGDFTRQEFAALSQRLSAVGALPLRSPGRAGRAVNLLYRSTALYPAAAFLYRRIFVPHILPRLSRN